MLIEPKKSLINCKSNRRFRKNEPAKIRYRQTLIKCMQILITKCGLIEMVIKILIKPMTSQSFWPSTIIWAKFAWTYQMNTLQGFLNLRLPGHRFYQYFDLNEYCFHNFVISACYSITFSICGFAKPSNTSSSKCWCFIKAILGDVLSPSTCSNPCKPQ